jgi:DNA-binding NtrC family response regulator
MLQILVIEKTGEIQSLLKQRFSGAKISICALREINGAPDQFAQKAYDILIWDADVSKPGEFKDLELLRSISRDFPQTRIIIVSDWDDPEPTLESIEEGPYRYIRRPVDGNKLCAQIDSALKEKSVVREGMVQRPDVRVPVEFEGILVVSLPMRTVIQRVTEAASTDIPVLITGETGTGKDLVASAIHNRSQRRSGPYIPVNTGAMPPGLIASELFGYEKGAYTGALAMRRGLFEQADGGTIFLDEITTMDEKAQISLLRVLEEKKFRRVGGEKDIRVDVRVVAATNEDLHEAIAKNHFREDLYYRLDVFPIDLPPLRSRPGAVTLLSNYFVSYFDAVYKKDVRVIAPDSYRFLRRYSWPGNVRELKNVIQRAVLMAKGKELTPDLIPQRIKEAAGARAENTDLSPVHLGMTLDAVEREAIVMTLAATGGNKKEAAQILGISRRALYNKLSKHGLF